METKEFSLLIIYLNKRQTQNDSPAVGQECFLIEIHQLISAAFLIQRGFDTVIVVIVFVVVVYVMIDTGTKDVWSTAAEWNVVICRPEISVTIS